MGVRLNYPVGTKIIICPNEPGPLIIGDVIGYENFGKQDDFILYTDQYGCTKFSFDKNPAIWCEERESALRKLNWAERYNVTTRYDSIDEKERLRKESFEYLGYEYKE